MSKPSESKYDPKASAGPAVIVAGALALAATLIKPWEGKRNTTYLDIVGVPTVCYGHTGPDVERGKRYTNAECEAFLQSDMAEHYGYVKRCILDKATVPLSINEQAALTSFTFNVGPRGVCGSTLQKHAIAGNKNQMCGQLMHWVYAGGKPVKGLVNRRKAEYAMCMGKGYE